MKVLTNFRNPLADKGNPFVFPLFPLLRTKRSSDSVAPLAECITSPGAMPLSSHRTQTVHLRNVLAYSAQLVSLRRRNGRQTRRLCRETRMRRWRPACKVTCDAKHIRAECCSLLICFMFSWYCCAAATFLASWLYWPKRCSCDLIQPCTLSYVLEMTAYMSYHFLLSFERTCCGT